MSLQVDVDLLAGKREQGPEGKRGLLDNYDDVEGYYNFQVCSCFVFWWLHAIAWAVHTVHTNR